MKNTNYICCMPYLRNSIAYDHDFWYTCCRKWWYLRGFIIFSKFSFSGLLVGAKNSPKWQKNLFVALYILEKILIWSSFVVHKCRMLISPYILFHFLKILIFNIVIGGKQQKVVQNDKNGPNSICRAPYLKNHKLYGHHLW